MSELAEFKFMVTRQEIYLAETDIRLVTLGKVIACSETAILEAVEHMRRLAKAGYPVDARIVEQLAKGLTETDH